jgi:hypothetical protein
MNDNIKLTPAPHWQRLTPTTSNDGVIPPALWYQEPTGLHRLEAGCNEMCLTPAEALAFAAQLPEVRALVEKVAILLNEAIEVNEHVEDVPIELWDGVSATLRPFKDLINV